MGLNNITIATDSDLPSALAQINRKFEQLAAENMTKTIAQQGGLALEWGKLKNGTYGIILSDPNNKQKILIGFHRDGRPIIAVTKTRDVVEALGE